MLNSSQLSALIKTQRQLSGLSQSQLASATGLSTSFIRDAETQAGRCTLDKLLAVLEALNIDLTCELEVLS
jgi:HTH-type transcriptional regulator / antitoxin HipB